MAAITWANVVKFVPSLSTVDAEVQNALLAHVNILLDVNRWGGEESPKLRLGRIYVAAHFATLAVKGASGLNGAGPLASSTASKLSRSWSQVNVAVYGTWATTTWGQLYWSLVRTTTAILGTVS